MDDLKEKLFGDNWPKRRRVLYAVLAWAMGSATYIVVAGTDNELMRTAFVMLVGLILSVTGSYVFGAVWDDADKRKNLPTSAPGDEK